MACLRLQGLDWGVVHSHGYQPPYTPKVMHSYDTSHFSPPFGLGAWLHPFVLTPEQQALFKDF